MSANRGLLMWMLSLVFLILASPKLFAPIYMKLGDIKGDVTATGYKDWIDIHSTQWGVGRAISAPTGGNRDASAPNISEIVVTKLQDVSSAHLFAEAAFGKEKQVEIHLVRTEEGKLEPYLKMTLDNTLISGYSQSSGGDRPSESLSLNFTKITLVYLTYENGQVSSTKTVSYNLATGTGSGP